MAIDVEKLKKAVTPNGLPFRIQKLRHVVLQVSDLHRSVEFYTRVLGFKISDVYPEEMVPGGMAFMRFNPVHHGVALVGRMPASAAKRELDHVAFEVATLDEVFRARKYLREHNVPIVFEGRRRAGVQIAVEFHDPDGHHLEIYWGLDQIGSDGQARPTAQWRAAQTLEEAVANPVPGQHPVLFDPSLIERKP